MPTPSIFTSVINSYLPEPQASLLNGIIFGIPLKTSKIFYQQLKTVGLLHLVVLSGMNITLLAAIVAYSTRFLSKVMTILITILVVTIFIIFVGPQAPIIRAGIMSILTFVAILYGRKNYIFYAMFLSIFCIFIFWPQWLTTISLQLTYASTLGIILFAKKPEVPEKENLISDVIADAKNNFWTSLAAQIFTAPIIFFYFKEISLISPLSNILIAPTVPTLMVFGFLAAILGKINYFLGLIPAYLCYGLLSYATLIINLLAKLPYVYIKL